MSSAIRCSLGGGPGREHAFPRWLLRDLGVGGSHVQGVHYAPPHRGFEPLSVRIQAYASVVFGKVCQECNSGWMSQLEQDAAPVLKSLILPRSETFNWTKDR